VLLLSSLLADLLIPKSASNNSPKTPKKETENQSKQQSFAAGTQVKVEDENMKKSNKIKLSPIKGQTRQIKVESPGSKSDSESKDQPKETGSTTDGGGCIYDTEPFSGFCSDGYKESY
jgi:hypothetical protein